MINSPPHLVNFRITNLTSADMSTSKEFLRLKRTVSIRISIFIYNLFNSFNGHGTLSNFPRNICHSKITRDDLIFLLFVGEGTLRTEYVTFSGYESLSGKTKIPSKLNLSVKNVQVISLS